MYTNVVRSGGQNAYCGRGSKLFLLWGEKLKIFFIVGDGGKIIRGPIPHSIKSLMEPP